MMPPWLGSRWFVVPALMLVTVLAWMVYVNQHWCTTWPRS
jgi:hypothetical protein